MLLELTLGASTADVCHTLAGTLSVWNDVKHIIEAADSSLPSEMLGTCSQGHLDLQILQQVEVSNWPCGHRA